MNKDNAILPDIAPARQKLLGSLLCDGRGSPGFLQVAFITSPLTPMATASITTGTETELDLEPLREGIRYYCELLEAARLARVEAR